MYDEGLGFGIRIYGPGMFAADCSSLYGTIEIHPDAPDGLLAGSCSIGPTGYLSEFDRFTCRITEHFHGIHDIFLVFGNTGVFMTDRIEFVKKDWVERTRLYYFYAKFRRRLINVHSFRAAVITCSQTLP